MPVKQPPRIAKTPAGSAHPETWDLPRRGLADGLHPDASFSRVDTFTGWIEVFPTQTEKAEEVIKNKKQKTKNKKQTNKKQKKPAT